MVAQVQSYAVGTAVTTSGFSGPKPTGLAVGDLLFGFLAVRSAGNFTHTNFTAYSGPTDQAGAVKSVVVLRIADAGDVAASSFSFSCTTSEVRRAIMVRVDGQAASGFLAGQSSNPNSASTTLDTTTITPSVANCLLMFFGAVGDDTGLGSNFQTANNDPSDWDLIFDEATTTGTDLGMMLAVGTYTSTSATGTIQATLATSEQGVAHAIMIAPAITDFTGTLAATESQDTISAAGTQEFIGTLASTESLDTITASGTNQILSGTMAATEGQDTIAATGEQSFTGTFASTESLDTIAAAGELTLSGTLAATESLDTIAAAGTQEFTGTLTATESQDTISATGTVGDNPGITGTLASTEGTDQISSSGALTIAGNLASTESPDSMAASGGLGYTGTLASTENQDTIAAAGAMEFTGTLASTEGQDTIAAAGSVSTISGALSVNESQDLIAVTGTVGDVFIGTLAITERADTGPFANAKHRLYPETRRFRIMASDYNFRLYATDLRFKLEAKARKFILQAKLRSFIFEGGTVETFEKQPWEEYVFAFDFFGKLPPGVTPVSATLTAYNVTDSVDATNTVLQSSSATIEGLLMNIGVRAGVTAKDYQISARGVFSNGAKLEEDCLMQVREK